MQTLMNSYGYGMRAQVVAPAALVQQRVRRHGGTRCRLREETKNHGQAVQLYVYNPNITFSQYRWQRRRDQGSRARRSRNKPPAMCGVVFVEASRLVESS